MRISLCTVLLLFFVSLLPTCGLNAQQNKIDSLLHLLEKDRPDTGKVTHLNLLSRQYLLAGSYGSALHYAQNALLLANSLPEEAGKHGASTAFYNIGSVYSYQSNYSMALDNYFKALELSHESESKKLSATILSNIGIVYYSQGEYPKALDSYFKALKIDELYRDTIGMTRRLGNIGNVYSEQKDYSKALEYYFKALKFAEEQKNKERVGMWLGNIGIVYKEQARALSPDSSAKKEQLFTKALDCYFRYLKMGEEIGDKYYQSTALGNIGNVYAEKKDYLKARDYYIKALKIDEEIGNKEGIAIRLSRIGYLHAEEENYKEGEKYFLRALAIDTAIGFLIHAKETYEELSILYSQTKRHRLAYEYYKSSMMLKDSLFNEEKSNEITRKEMNYEFEKREAAVRAEADKQATLAVAEKQRQRSVLILVCCVLLLVVAFAGFIFRALRVTRKQKQFIEQQKYLVEEKQKEILSSINYAKRIQTALLPTEKFIDRTLKRMSSNS